MPVLVLVIAAAAGWFTARTWALAITVAAWIGGAWLVGYGPAGDGTQETGSIVFWGPWIVVLLLALGVSLLMGVLRSRRRTHARDSVN